VILGKESPAVLQSALVLREVLGAHFAPVAGKVTLECRHDFLRRDGAGGVGRDAEASGI